MPVNRPKLSISQCKNTRERPVVNYFPLSSIKNAVSAST